MKYKNYIKNKNEKDFWNDLKYIKLQKPDPELKSTKVDTKTFNDFFEIDFKEIEKNNIHLNELKNKINEI